MNARETIDSALRAALPPGVPPSYREIVTAKFDGSGRKRRALGVLVMFDGRPARVEVWQAGPCTAHHFTDMPGGAVSFEDGAWHRVDEDGELIPGQPDLFAQAAE